MSNKELKDFQSTRNIENPELQVQNQGYKTSYQAAKKAIKETGGNVIDFSRMAGDAFKDLNWSTSYGGKKWAEIAKGYIDLRQSLNNYNPEAPSPSSESAEKLIAAIDHAFDLEHNTGTVLNKVKYFDDKGYDWIKTALDYKRDNNMYDIASKASSDMRKLGLEVLKVAGMQEKQLKKVPAEAGIPKKKIKLTGVTSKKFKGEHIKDLSSLPVGSLISDDDNEYVSEVLYVNDAMQRVRVKFIAVKYPNSWLGKTHNFTFNFVKENLHIVTKQEEDNLLKDYFVDPSYKPEVASIHKKKIKLAGDTSKNNEGPIKDPSSLQVGSLIQDEFNEYVSKVTDVNDSSKKITVKIIAVINQKDKNWLGKNQTHSFNVSKKFFLVKKQDEANLLKDYFVDPSYKPEVTSNTSAIQEGDIVKLKGFGSKEVFAKVIKAFNLAGEGVYNVMVTSSKNPNISVGTIFYGQTYGYLEKEKETDKSVPSETFQIGDAVKVKNNDMEGTVELIDQEDEAGPIVQIKVTKANFSNFIGIKTWYPVDQLEKISTSNVVKLQGFGGKKPAKIDPLSLSTRIDIPFMLTIGSILIHTRSSDLYIVQMVNGPEDYIKIKLVASNDALEFPNYTEPELYNGGTIARNFRLIENQDKKEVFASYEFIDLSTASRKAAKAAKADEPAPRERDDSDLEVGNYYVISNETLIVQITGLPRGYVEYLIIAGDKKHARWQGQRSGMPKDMFVDGVNFALTTEDVPEYIEIIKNKPGSR